MQKNGKIITCPQCGTQRYLKLSYLKMGMKHCSAKCGNASRRGIIPSNLKYAQSKSPMQKGHKAFVKYGKEHWAWQGDNPSYRAVHGWLVKNYGNPQLCENPRCIYPRKDKRGYWMEKPRAYQWANISKTYKRDRSDFMRLCASCHKLYDMRGKLV